MVINLHDTLCEILFDVGVLAWHLCFQPAKAHCDFMVLSGILGGEFDLFEGACGVLIQSTDNLNQE